MVDQEASIRKQSSTGHRRRATVQKAIDRPTSTGRHQEATIGMASSRGHHQGAIIKGPSSRGYHQEAIMKRPPSRGHHQAAIIKGPSSRGHHQEAIIKKAIIKKPPSRGPTKTQNGPGNRDNRDADRTEIDRSAVLPAQRQVEATDTRRVGGARAV